MRHVSGISIRKFSVPLVVSIFLLSLAFSPAIASAQAASDLESFASQIIDIINNLLVPLLLAIAFIVFVWGVFQYFIFGSNDEATKTKGRDKILYGLSAFLSSSRCGAS